MHFISKYKFPLIISLLWIIIILFVNPTGEFPLNDDWAYSHNVHFLSEKGEFRFSPWPAMTLLTQTLWGAMFCKIFGFSFLILRVSTIVLSITSIFLIYHLVNKITLNKRMAFIASMIVLFNPLYFSLSFTFMTEVHYIFFYLLSLLLYYHTLKTDRLWTFFLATFFALCTLLIRQTGLIIPIAFGVVWIFFRPRNFRTIFIAVFPVILAVMVLFTYKQWRIATNNIEGSYSSFSALFKTLQDFDIAYFLERLGIILMYLGFLLLPLTIIILPKLRVKISKRKILYFGLIAVVACIGFWFSRNSFPTGNIFYNFGLGPKILKDTSWGDNVTPYFTDTFWDIFRAISILSILTLLFYFTPGESGFKSLKGYLTRLKGDGTSQFRLMLIVMALGFSIYLMINPTFFDRYVLPLSCTILLIVMTAHHQISTRLKWGVFALISLLGVFDNVLTHDYFMWNRARWTAINDLVENDGITRNRIDGGFEFNSWYKTAPLQANNYDRTEKSWWCVDKDEFLITSGDFPGFKKLKGYAYQRYFPCGIDSVFVLWHPPVPVLDYNAFPIKCDFEKHSKDKKLVHSTDTFFSFHANNKLSKTDSHSGKYSFSLNKTSAYGPVYKFYNLIPGEQLSIHVWRKGSTEGALVLASDTSNQVYFSTSVGKVDTEKSGWELLELNYTVPEGMNETLRVYFWSNGNGEILFDDFFINREFHKK